MWILYALASALFAGITSILAKIGIEKTNTNLVTALRTMVVLLFAWIMVFITGTQKEISQLTAVHLFFIITSGIATGASWLCYFKALAIGDVNKVTPIDKSSTILTMLLAAIFLQEKITVGKAFAMLFIGIGTYLMIEKKKKELWEEEKIMASGKKSWFFYAVMSAIFASLTSILGKVGMQGINSNLGTAIRTIVVLIMAWGIVISTKKQKEIRGISRKSMFFIVISGFSTGLSWLCYYHALQLGDASIVAPIDKLSILVTVLFASVWLKERLSKKAGFGLVLLTFGTLLLVVV